MSSQRLEDMWKEAQTRFRDLTGKDLLLPRSTSPDDLRKALEARVEEQKGKTSPELAKVKDAGLNILSCIKLLGGVVAQGAAMVRVLELLLMDKRTQKKKKSLMCERTGIWSGRYLFQRHISAPGRAEKDKGLPRRH